MNQDRERTLALRLRPLPPWPRCTLYHLASAKLQERTQARILYMMIAPMQVASARPMVSRREHSRASCGPSCGHQLAGQPLERWPVKATGTRMLETKVLLPEDDNLLSLERAVSVCMFAWARTRCHRRRRRNSRSSLAVGRGCESGQRVNNILKLAGCIWRSRPKFYSLSLAAFAAPSCDCDPDRASGRQVA